MPNASALLTMSGVNADVNVETLTGAKTIDASDPFIQRLDPGGSGRDVTLPTEKKVAPGTNLLVVNTANGDEDLTVKNEAASTVGTVGQDEAGLFLRDKAGNWDLCCVMTITG